MIITLSLKDIGYRCKLYRLGNGYLQSDVAKDLNYSTENISAFENGKNDNLRIFMWYVNKGMDIAWLYPFRGLGGELKHEEK